MKKIILLYTLISIAIILFGIFVVLSLYYRVENSIFSILSIILFLSSTLAIIISFKRKHLRLMAWGAYLTLVITWFFWYGNIQASNDRNWQKDVAVLSYATQKNNLIYVHNIRNFKYFSEENYEVSYYDETFDIDKLDGIDFIATHWMGPNVAHTFLSFSFSDNKHLAISIEARKEVGESYSMIRGFFKDNELYYVVADERDLIGLRTNIRKNPPEHVYMYQINAKQEDIKKVFLNYIKKINTLKNTPEFYNTLTTNCTTSIWNNSLVDYSNMKFNWEILVSGYTVNYLYENGLLKTYNLSFKELQKKAYINPLVEDKTIDISYSSKIRQKI
jgi:hypothetical protein